jgi:hypothetical protein
MSQTGAHIGLGFARLATRNRSDAEAHPSKEIETMRTRQSKRAASFVRSTAVLAVVASVGYLAGAIIDNTLATRDATAASAQPLAGPQVTAPPSLQTDDGYDGFDWARAGERGVEAPRECDATRGPVYECVFMD